VARADRDCIEPHAGQAALSDADTIVALSSGRPPAAIAIVRISGPAAVAAAQAVAGTLPPPRRASLRALRAAGGELLDRALVLFFPASGSVTGQDLVEFHCHGGMAVVAAVEAALLAGPSVRAAKAGEFTRRAMLFGRIDLVQAQGLADLLAAETEGERRLAMSAAEGTVSRAIGGWMERLTAIAAELEASIDFAEEGDVAAEAASLQSVLAARAGLVAEIEAALAAPPVERWRDGWRIVIAGPPNAGKSTLLNLLAAREAAIVSPVAGTTRDRIEATVQRSGVGYVLIDTAGLRETPGDEIERIGIGRAAQAMASADVILWLDDVPPEPGSHSLWVHARADVPGRSIVPAGAAVAVSRDDPASIGRLWNAIEAATGSLALVSVPLRQVDQHVIAGLLRDFRVEDDAVLLADSVRRMRQGLGALLGVDATEVMLDQLFGRFCVGK
jgi:tRNA modification GTPase